MMGLGAGGTTASSPARAERRVTKGDLAAVSWADGPANDRVDAGELYAFLGRQWRTSP